MGRLLARRKALRRQEIQKQVEKKTYNWRDVGKLVYTYDKRTHLGLQKKSWDKEELEKWKAERKYKGQTKSSLYRIFKRKLRHIKQDVLEQLKKEKEKESSLDRDEDIFDAAENRDEQQKQDTRDRNESN